MTVSKRLRFEILRRDNHACRYCGGVAPDATITVDHVVPVALGGSDDPSNLVAACKDCNAGKSSVPAGVHRSGDECSRCGKPGCEWQCGYDQGHVAGWDRLYDHYTLPIYQANVLAAVCDDGGWKELVF